MFKIQFSIRFLITLLFLLTLCSVPKTIFADINEGLVAYYPFNGNAIDESGNENANNNNGNIHEAILSTDRFTNLNSAYKFDGINDYIEVQNIEDLNFGNGDMAISVWVKPDKPSSGSRILSKFQHTSKPYYDIGYFFSYFSKSPYNYFIFGIGDGESKSEALSKLICEGAKRKWYHLVGVRNTSLKTVSLYINGALEKSVKDKTTDITNSSNFRIASHPPCCSCEYFSGTIDDIRIYNRSLSRNEIETLYQENGWTDNCDIIDSDNDGVIDQWDSCPETPLNSYVNSIGCPLLNKSALSGQVLIKGKPLTKGSATLFQSGELFQKSPIDNNGWYQFESVADKKSINIMIRKPVE